MDTTKTGGPAFPEVPGDCNGYEGKPGMTLRDYFAAKAMQAYIARLQPHDMDDATFDAKISRWSYETADAMLRARASTQK